MICFESAGRVTRQRQIMTDSGLGDGQHIGRTTWDLPAADNAATESTMRDGPSTA